ncbi:oxygen-independent coproporphyrinogen III oxidase [Alcanivorax quisquiliarum]|uniref:Coproporphyrinogen-III oxidase n=1 Tax=Alcanivorax quisquiliarum TaxID=2933565 RepID=A0ABT0E3E8_9GAMM|nr:oxygen-independent coproporphyrinogen III oxidase [Alcanivorax quisquiliarum]MCK0536345.1 oxygen-independent coproporphyrinogen III oxidase [Alcanivorax quisquiliarum]
MSIWDTEIIQRYGGPGPRYTSYPAATCFHEEVGHDDYVAAVRAGNEARRPLSLYMHLPFCEHVCFYCACNRIITGDKRLSAPYLDTLLAEMAQKSELVDAQRPVVQIHWGGGTPTFFDDGQLTRLMHHTGRHFRLLDNDRGDYGIELDPRTVSRARIGLLRGLGFNRISLGVQDLDARVQQAVNRVQPYELVREAFEASRDFGFRSISVDLIYGLPWQSESSLARTIEQLLALQPDRIALYNYAHLPARFKIQRQIPEAALPAPAEKLRMLSRAGTMFAEAGYLFIGMDHFARPDDDLAKAQVNGILHRNFQGYSLHGDADLLGMGISAISQIGALYAQNHRHIEGWQTAVQRQKMPVSQGYLLDQDDEIRRNVIMALLSHMKVDLQELGARWQVDAASYFAAELASLAPLERDGLVEFDGRTLQLTAPGRLAARAVAVCFDRYHSPSETLRFSRII